MKLTLRPYHNEEDYWRMCQFLRDVMFANDLHQYSWRVARLDYWWWFANPDIEKINPEEAIFFWGSEMGEIAAATASSLHP